MSRDETPKQTVSSIPSVLKSALGNVIIPGDSSSSVELGMFDGANKTPIMVVNPGEEAILPVGMEEHLMVWCVEEGAEVEIIFSG